MKHVPKIQLMVAAAFLALFLPMGLLIMPPPNEVPGNKTLKVKVHAAGKITRMWVVIMKNPQLVLF